MKKLMLISGEYPPRVGGLADYSCRLSRGLKYQGWEVYPATTGVLGSDVPSCVRATVLASSWGWGATAHAVSLARRVGAEVVSLQYQTGCYGMHPSINLLPLLFRAVSVPVVTTFHDFREPYLFPKAGKVRRWVNVLLALASDFVILVEPGDVGAVPPRVRSRVRLVPIASNVDPVVPFDAESRRSQFGFRIVFFGLANWSKGLDLAIATLGWLKEKDPSNPWHLRIVGGGLGTDPSNRAFREQCLGLISRLGLQGSVSFRGELPSHLVTEELLGADVALLPYRDGVSYRRGSLLACLCHGLPVVTSGPLPKLVPDGWPSFVSGLNLLACPEPRPELLGSELLRLAGDAELRALLARGAVETASFFSWERVVAAMDKLLSEALSGVAA